MTLMTSRHDKLLATHGLKATYVEAADESVDSEIQLSYAPTDAPTGYSVQIGLHGYYYVNQHGGEGDDFWMKTCGEFRALMTALKHAAKLVALVGSGSASGCTAAQCPQS